MKQKRSEEKETHNVEIKYKLVCNERSWIFRLIHLDSFALGSNKLIEHKRTSINLAWFMKCKRYFVGSHAYTSWTITSSIFIWEKSECMFFFLYVACFDRRKKITKSFSLLYRQHFYLFTSFSRTRSSEHIVYINVTLTVDSLALPKEKLSKLCKQIEHFM